MQEAIERIERYTAQGRREFDQNELVQTWVVHHLEILGEAARAVFFESVILSGARSEVAKSQNIVL